MPYLAAAPRPLPGFLNALAGPLDHYGYWPSSPGHARGLRRPGAPARPSSSPPPSSLAQRRLNVVAVGVSASSRPSSGTISASPSGISAAARWPCDGAGTSSSPRSGWTRPRYFFDRHGGKIIVVARFIEGLRQANGIIAGISGMRWLRFLFFNAIGAALWVGTWVSIGYLAGNHIDTIYHYITRYSLLRAHRGGGSARGVDHPARPAPSPPGRPARQTAGPEHDPGRSDGSEAHEDSTRP